MFTSQANYITEAYVSTTDVSPRVAMYRKLPKALQPFLTWLTAQPVEDEPTLDRPAQQFVAIALLQVLLGAAVSIGGLEACWAAVPIGMLLTTAGLGLLQVGVFHYCSHGTVFRSRAANLRVGRLISAILLFKHFDHYRHEHMLHHSNNKLLTEDDEFADFVFNTCRLDAGVPLPVLRRRVLLSLVSPLFHSRFLHRRVQAAWMSHDWRHNLVGMGAWGLLAVLALLSGQWLGLLLAWVLPATILLQAATVGRILCEHSFPAADVIAARGRDLTSNATGGVFPGIMPPSMGCRSLRGYAAWLGWWANMLVVQVFVRMIVLVGDAPCHDFHHRKPASRKWTSYIQARHRDAAQAAASQKPAYQETWGLFTAIDATLASLARLPPGGVPGHDKVAAVQSRL